MYDDFSFSTSETAQMLNAFKRNNIKVTFENFDDFNKALNEIYPPLFESFCRNFRKHGHEAIMYEHDMELQKITTYHTMFKYYYIQYFEERFVELFKHVIGSLSTWRIKNASKHEKVFRTYDDEFAYCYSADNKLEGYYFMIHKSFDPSDNEIITQQMFKYFGYKEADIHKYIRKNSDIYTIYYLGYNTARKLSKIGTIFNQQMLYDDAVVEKFKDYKHFYDLIKKYDKDIYVQFDANNPDYIGVEINPSLPSKENIPAYLDELVDLGIFTNEQKEYILYNKKTKEAKISCVKYRWENKDSFNVKWYNRVITE